MIGKNHKPKRGWTMAIIDMDLIPKEDWQKLPWIMISRLSAYKDASEEEKQEFFNEIMEFSKD